MKFSLTVAVIVGALTMDAVFAAELLSDAARNNSEMMNAAPVAAAQVRAGGVKALFLGNSITLHGPLASIGWTSNWGMAASAPEKDFVHRVVRGIEGETGRSVDLRVRNLADFERGFETWDAAKELQAEVAFEPDYLVIALGENVRQISDPSLRLAWQEAFRKLLGCFFAGRKRPFAVVRGVFWPCEWKDKALAHAASDYAVPFVKADFGNDPDMKAAGLFPHKGIQAHPGDRGMAAIADRILGALFPTNAGYAVTANGAAVRVRPIRVSAMPYNAWRPGYQRPMDQTEISGMAHMQSDGPLTLTVRPDRAFSRATVRPLSKGVKPVVEDGAVTFTVPGPGQYVLELDDWHRPLELFVDPVRDFAKERAEANIVFGPGRHEPIVVKLRSHDRVYIDRDAVVCGSFQVDGAEDVRISGYGVICGSRNRRHEINLPREAPGTCYRDGQDSAIRIVDSKNVTVDGPTVIDSCCWCVEAFRSSDLVFDRVKVTGAWRYNTDGIDICNSQRVRILDCYVHSFDDSIVLKGIPEDRDKPVEDVRVERCVCWCGWGRTLEIGYETWAPSFRGIVFEDCDLIRNFGGALSVHLGGDAPVESVAYRRIRIEYGPHDLPQILQKDRDAPYVGKPGACGYWLMVSNDKMYKEGGGSYGAKEELAKLPHGTFGHVMLKDIDIYVEPGGRLPATAVGPEKGTAFGTLSVSNVRLNGKPWDPLAPVPRLVVDGQECEMLSKAFSLMREAIVTEPVYGFTEPFFPPGAAYGKNWWQLDSSTVLEAWKWCDFGFCKRSIENFCKVQRPDGRIPLWGCDRIPRKKGWFSEQSEGVSSLPTLFKTAHSLATMADDPEFARRMYELNSRYLGWWRSNRVDRTTGLVSSVFEETFPPWLGVSGEFAGVDTGVLVALGAEWTAEIADSLGEGVAAADLRAFSARTFAAMRERMWDGKTGLFRPYRIATSGLGFESAEGFYMFADRNLDAERRAALLRSLTGPRFAWGRMPLASMAVDSPCYTNTVGRTYQANASWSGNVWSLINRWTVHALLRAGLEREAVELARATKRMIDRAGTFDEFYLTTDGSAQGGEKYLWTAADYAILVIEDLLGISYDGKSGELRVRPRIKADFCLENLSLPDGSRVTVSSLGGKVTVEGAKAGDAASQKRAALFRERMFSPEARDVFYDEAVNAFRTHYDDSRADAVRNGRRKGLWQGEYWGKTMLSGAVVAEMTGSDDLKAWLREKALAFVREFQQPDGYLCTYRDREFVGGKVGAEPGKEVFCWNLWGRKYTMWALIELARVCGEPKLLDAAAKMMDQEIAQLRETKVEIWDTGYFSGIPSMSVLKPLLLLYRATGKGDYLDFARHLVSGWERADGSKPNLIANAFSNKPLHAWYGDTFWAKAYEIMSCLEGLVEFAAVTGEKRYLEAVVRIADQLRRHEMNAIGSVGFGDKFHNAARIVNVTTEVCDVIHWMRLTHVLYRATGEVRYLDDFEFAYLNAFLGGIHRDGKWAAQFTCSHGSRQQTAEHQVGMKCHHCCVDNSPRAFADAWDAAVDVTDDGLLSVNLYSSLDKTVDGTTVTIAGRYPVETEVTVDVKPTIARKVRFRRPGWCEGLAVDGKPVVAQDGWFLADVPAEGRRFVLSFARSVKAVPFRGEPIGLGVADQVSVFEKEWIYPEMKGLARQTPGTSLVYGPVVLAKSISSGTPADEVFRDRLVGKAGARLSIRPRTAVDSAGAWTLTLDDIDIPVCDYATASDRDDPDNRYSIWF